MELPEEDKDSAEEEELNCPICLSRLASAVETDCGHAFCGSCIIAHLRTNNICPLCRNRVCSAHPSWSLRKLVENKNAAEHKPPPTETDKQEERQLDTNLPRSLPQGFVAGLWSDWQSLLAIFRGAHDWRFWQAWIALVIGVLYVLSPFDLLPDYVAHGVVLLDDLLIMLWLAYFLRSLARENRQ